MRQLIVLILLSLFASCSSDNAFLIDKNKVGVLTDKTLITEVESLFENYTLEGLNPDPSSKYISADVEVFNEAGELVMVIEPTTRDDDAKIKSVKIFDNQYKTKNGLNANSSFEAIEKNYTISSIQTTISEVIVSIEEIDAFVTIKKTELPSELQFDMEKTIKATQIPSDAKIKGFWVNFEQ